MLKSVIRILASLDGLEFCEMVKLWAFKVVFETVERWRSSVEVFGSRFVAEFGFHCGNIDWSVERSRRLLWH